MSWGAKKRKAGFFGLEFCINGLPAAASTQHAEHSICTIGAVPRSTGSHESYGGGGGNRRRAAAERPPSSMSARSARQPTSMTAALARKGTVPISMRGDSRARKGECPLFGGGGGNRTRVRKGSYESFYTLSRFVFLSHLRTAERQMDRRPARLFRRPATDVAGGYPELSSPR